MKTKIKIIVITTILLINISEAAGQLSTPSQLAVSTDFISGGGSVNIISSKPAIIRFKPHNEGEGGWGQMWWYFKVEGLIPGEQITFQLQNEQTNSGISPQAFFSYDQKVWGLTSTGENVEIEGMDYFVYKHIVRDEKIWIAYDLPYTPEHMEKLLIEEANRDPEVEVFELCRTKKNRPVKALSFIGNNNDEDKKYGIWLQARAHAFETGGSWVLHELAKWLLSGDPAAKALRSGAIITIVPIVDVDGVVEGRTGKNQMPYDHNRHWEKDPAYWVETEAIKSKILNMSSKNIMDLFIDFHGPGNLSNPYFIIPFSDDLPFEKQKQNRTKFFEILNSKPHDKVSRQFQSMTNINYSERSEYMDSEVGLTSSKWVTLKTNSHTVALTLEVNMNTHLSTLTGYQAEAITLGRAISKYFVNNYHIK